MLNLNEVYYTFVHLHFYFDSAISINQKIETQSLLSLNEGIEPLPHFTQDGTLNKTIGNIT